MMDSHLSHKLKHYRLNQQEYEKILTLLQREPHGVEWGLFSALWSEHCSYKSSKIHLKKFSLKSAHVLNIEGENAGIVDLGQNEKIAFKMESHNHPSFIEPFQGAATGVGGILRDIFTMGARPIMLADFLCFGETTAPRMKSIISGVVKGISTYGNCVGVPTCTGDTEFHSDYNNNILVNAMAVGLFTEENPIILSKAQGVGNYVVYVGAKTGKDGIHGASMASESFDDKNESKKPNVQIGDPFYEKLLIEACLEVVKENLVVAMQDMGAAGLTSSSFEMAAKGNVGIELDLAKVPLRDSTMSPEEILLSESQERMLLICEPSKYEKIKNIFNKWDLESEVIGLLQRDRKVKLKWSEEILTEIDPCLLVDQAPQYERKYFAWNPRLLVHRNVLMKEENVFQKLMNYFSSINGASKNWIYEQYDQRVGLRTVWDARHSLAIQKLPSGRALSVATGCRPSLMRVDAQLGAYDSVFYPALKMAIKGFKALAVTDCLNFGNPENESVMSEFVTSVEAIAHAAQLLNAPVISGNVSFYNETLGKNITSTPATGMVGIRESLTSIPSDEFENEQEKVFIISLKQAEFRAGIEPESLGYFGVLDPKKMSQAISLLHQFSSQNFFSSAKVLGTGGLAVGLIKMSSKFTLRGDPHFFKNKNESELFIESMYEVVVSVPLDRQKLFNDMIANQKVLLTSAGIEITEIGITHQNLLEMGSLQLDPQIFLKAYHRSQKNEEY